MSACDLQHDCNSVRSNASCQTPLFHRDLQQACGGFSLLYLSELCHVAALFFFSDFALSTPYHTTSFWYTEMGDSWAHRQLLSWLSGPSPSCGHETSLQRFALTSHFLKKSFPAHLCICVAFPFFLNSGICFPAPPSATLSFHSLVGGLKGDWSKGFYK